MFTFYSKPRWSLSEPDFSQHKTLQESWDMIGWHVLCRGSEDCVGVRKVWLWSLLLAIKYSLPIFDFYFSSLIDRTLPVCGWTQINSHRFATGLEFVGQRYVRTEQTISEYRHQQKISDNFVIGVIRSSPWHSDTNNTSQTAAGVQSYSHLSNTSKRIELLKSFL